MRNEANPIPEVAAERAAEAVQRLINSHFHNDDRARCSIPANPREDDDLIASAYVKQSASRIAAFTAERTLIRGLLGIIQQSLVDQYWQTMGGYRGKTLFLSQDLLNKIDSALEVKGDAE